MTLELLMLNKMSKMRLLLTLLCSLFIGSAVAQDVIPTKGKEFWVGFMQNYEVEEWQEELNIFITSDQSTVGTIQIPGQGFSQAFSVTANQTTTVTLDNPIAEHFTNQVIENKGIYIETVDTVSVFAINFNGYTADGTKILPTPSLGTEYRISSYQGLSSWGSEFLIVATEDDTEIEIIPSASTLGGDPAGVPFIVEMDAGESYQVKVGNSSEDFMGTVIRGTEANGDCRPFAVFSGSGCTNIYTGCGACDHIYEQNFPVDTWGTDFYVVPFSFATSYTYRVLANEDNTSISVNGGAPFTLNAGEFTEYNDIPDVQCVSADKGISVTQYMEGITCGGAGDPAMCIMNDESQKIDNITFATVNSTVINQHGLNIIMNTADVGTLTLDGVTVPSGDFTPFPDCPSHSYAQITIAEGSHTLDAPNGFTAYVYGTGDAESYAYSVGSFTPAPPLIVDDVLCSSDTINIAVETGLLDVYWYAETNPEDTIAEGPQLTLIPPIVSDIYVAVGNQFQSGCVEEEFFSVEVPDPPTLEMFQADEEVCEFQSTQLGVTVTPNSGAYNYTWTPAIGLDDPNSPNPVATPLETTTYSVLVSTATGCGSNIDSLTIEVIDGNIANFEATSTDLDFCTGEQAEFTIDIQESVFEDNFDPGISWGLWDDIQNGTEDVGCGSATGNALWFNGTGQRSAESIDIDVANGGSVQFSLRIGSTSFPCDNVDVGEDIVLEYSTGGGGGPWTVMQTFFESGYATFTDVSVEIPIGAQTASTRFRWRQLANSGGNEDNWSIDNIYIGATNTDDYVFEWAPAYELSATDIANPIATPLVDTTYYVTMTDQVTGCVYSDSLTVDIGQGFVLEMTPDTALCDVQGIPISATPDIEGDYEWDWVGDDLNNPWIETPTASPTSTTTYNVTVTSVQGCEATGEVTVTVNQLLDLTVATTDDEFCAGESVDLSADVGGVSGLEYAWSPAEGLDDATAQNPVASPTVDVIYEVIVTDPQSGCVLSDEIALEVFDAFTIDAGEDQELCTVAGFQLDATDDTDDLLSWQWTNGNVLDNANVPNPTISTDGTYTFSVTAESPAGCASTDEVTITLLFESFDLGPNLDICAGDVATLDTGYGAEFDHDWSTDETTPTVDVNATGTYSVTVTSPEGCEEIDNIDVIVHDLPVVDLGVDPGLCEGETWDLDAGNAGADFDWSTDQSTQVITVNETDTYSVTVTDEFNCATEVSIDLVFHLNPVLELPDEHTMCEDEMLVLDAANPGSTYDWSTDEVTQTISVNQEGLYTVVVTNEFNCTSQDQTFLFVETYPVVDLGEDSQHCVGEVVTIDAGNPGLNYTWSTDETTQSIDVDNTGTYVVTVDNGYCFTTDDVDLLFNPLPVNNLFEDSLFCFSLPPYQVHLDAGNNGSTYVWSNGSDNQSINVGSEGLYTVQVTTEFGCSLTFDTFIHEVCYGDNLYLPNAFTPNNDGVNDIFQAVGDAVTEFELEVWNRWGEKIWETDDITQYWVGNVNGGEYYAETDVYVYVVRYKYITNVEGEESEWVEKTGHVSLIR